MNLVFRRKASGFPCHLNDRFRAILLVLTVLVSTNCKSTTSVGEAIPAGLSGLGLPDINPPQHKTGLWLVRRGGVKERYIQGVTKIDQTSKKWLFFSHGFAPGSQSRPESGVDLQFPVSGNQIDFATPLIAAGWNIVIFEWRPEADEGGVQGLFWAEAKIYSATTALNERWTGPNGVLRHDDMVAASMLDFYHLQVLQLLSEIKDPKDLSLWLVGHSLGNQLATLLAGRLYDNAATGQIDPSWVPKRLALLDPFWTLGNDAVKYPGQICREVAQRIADQVIIQILKTSPVLRMPYIGDKIADRNLDLISRFGEIVASPDYLSARNPIIRLVDAHNEAKTIWWASMIQGLAPSSERSDWFKSVGLPDQAAAGSLPVLGAATDEQALNLNKNPQSLRTDRGMSHILDIAIPLSAIAQPADESGDYREATIPPADFIYTGDEQSITKSTPYKPTDSPNAPTPASRGDSSEGGDRPKVGSSRRP